MLQAQNAQASRVSRYESCEALTVDQDAAYAVAVEAMKADETFAVESALRQSNYLNNVVEQGHRTTQG